MAIELSDTERRLLVKAFGLEDTSRLQIPETNSLQSQSVGAGVGEVELSPAQTGSTEETALLDPLGLHSGGLQTGGRSSGRTNLVPPGHLFNPSAYQELESVQGRSSGKAEAMLLQFNPDPGEQQKLWTFLLNPSALQFQTSAVYSEQVTLATRVPGQQYGHSKGLTLQIPAIRFNTFSVGRSQKSLRDALIELTKCKIEELQYNPPLLSFVFGSTRLAPCVLTEVQIAEAAWLGDGEPADTSFSMTLLEVPHPELIEQSRDVIERQFGVLEGELLAEPLTERQVEEGTTEAEIWLDNNIAEIEESDSEIASRINEGDYQIKIDPDSGRVTLLSGAGEELGEIGRWTGERFSDENSTLVPSEPTDESSEELSEEKTSPEDEEEDEESDEESEEGDDDNGDDED